LGWPSPASYAWPCNCSLRCLRNRLPLAGAANPAHQVPRGCGAGAADPGTGSVNPANPESEVCRGTAWLPEQSLRLHGAVRHPPKWRATGTGSRNVGIGGK
jgi:hypothetical protein